ncbi:MAG: hypothetical protein V4555_16130 [Acidobacteriota bacterium]
MRTPILLAALFIATTASAQWTLLDSHSTADFRGIDNVGHGIVWVSGTQGTILRSTDNGATWQRCTTPPGADKLDFRGIQAFDAQRAVAMSAGTGDLSRLYVTNNGCQTWSLFFTDPDADGFFDALQARFRPNLQNPSLMLLGDPIRGRFRLWALYPFAVNGKSGPTAVRLQPALNGESIFAASNSSLLVLDTRGDYLFGTGGPQGARIIHNDTDDELAPHSSLAVAPVGDETVSSGIFSIAIKTETGKTLHRWWKPYFDVNELYTTQRAVAVGGDYKKPDDATSVAAYCKSLDPGWGGVVWYAAETQPHGYRSSVAYDPTTKTWITVGPNGTDISTDDGRNWRALTPTSTEPPDADKNWNALSLPFVSGPHGRIGILNPAALKPQPKH